jgi:hypothetical protein
LPLNLELHTEQHAKQSTRKELNLVIRLQDWWAGLAQIRSKVKMPKGIVWTAVTAALAGVLAILFAVLDKPTYVLAYGFVSVASALLASRER